MPSKEERGLLVLIDDGFFARLDYETSLRRAAKKAEGEKAWKIPRTTVVRDLLKFALDHFAVERGEEIPTAELASTEELRATAAALLPAPEAKHVAPEPPAEEEAPEPEPVAPAPPPAEPVKRVEVGNLGGRNLRMLGVHRR